MARLLYAGGAEGAKTLRSEDAKNWTVASSGLEETPIAALAVLEEQPNVIFAGTRRKGVYRSEDFGASWQRLYPDGLGPEKVRCLCLDAKTANRLYAGVEPIGLYFSDDLGAHWSELEAVREHPWVAQVTYPVPGSEPHVRHIAIDPDDRARLYLALQNGFILKSSDGGSTFEVLQRGIDADVHTIAIDPADTSHISIATGGDSSRQGHAPGRALYSSHDGGANWQPMAMEFSQEYAIPLVHKPGGSAVLYSALAHGTPSKWKARKTGAESLLVRSRDGGAHWEALDLSAIAAASKAMVLAIAADPSDAAHLYGAMTSGQLIETYDEGDSWSLIDLESIAASELKCVLV